MGHCDDEWILCSVHACVCMCVVYLGYIVSVHLMVWTACTYSID